MVSSVVGCSSAFVVVGYVTSLCQNAFSTPPGCVKLAFDSVHRGKAQNSHVLHFTLLPSLPPPLQDLLPIQMWTSLVLILGMVETGAQYFGYR